MKTDKTQDMEVDVDFSPYCSAAGHASSQYQIINSSRLAN